MERFRRDSFAAFDAGFFFGKRPLLLPALAEGADQPGIYQLPAHRFLLVFAYGRLVERIGRDCGGNFKAYAEQKMGKKQ